MGTAYLYGNGGSGGGGSLGFEIVGGTTRPVKPTQNMVWANTDVEITSYALSATEPETPVEGMLWVIIADSGNIKSVFTVGKEWATVYTTSVKQYVNGTWVAVTAQSYQNGEWVDWITYLYNAGYECVRITGGWGQINGTLTKNADNLTLTNVNAPSTTYAAAYTENMVDLTNVKEIHAIASGTYSADGIPGCYVVVAKTKVTSRNVAAEIALLGTTQEHILNVSSLTGSFYVGVFAASSNNYTHTAKVQKVWTKG